MTPKESKLNEQLFNCSMSEPHTAQVMRLPDAEGIPGRHELELFFL